MEGTEPTGLTRKEPTRKELRKKQVMKKAFRDTQKVSTAVKSESVEGVPPPLIIRLPSQKGTPREPARFPVSLIFFTLFPLSFFTYVINCFVS